MVDEDKLRELKDRIETAKSSNTPITKKNKELQCRSNCTRAWRNH